MHATRYSVVYKLNTARATHIVMAVVATIISSYLMDDANVLGELHRYPMISTISYGLHETTVQCRQPRIWST